MFWYGPLWVDPVWDSLCFLDLDVCFLPQVRNVFSYYVFTYVFCPFLSSPFGTPIMQMLVHLLSQKSLKLLSFFLFFFPFSLNDFYYSVFQFAEHSFVSSTLLLIPFSVFLIPIVVFFISILFFVFSNSLLNISLCSSNVLPSSLIIIMIITLNFLLAILFPLHLVLLRFYLVPLFGTYSSVASFCSVFISTYFVGWLYFPVLEKWTYVGNIL